MTDKKLTIVHAIDTTGPGGAETVFLDIAQHLEPAGYEKLAIIKGPGWVADQLILRGIPYQIIKPHGFLSIPYYFQLYRLLRKKNVALIHAHLLGSALTYSIVSLLARIPLIATLHGRVDINPKERFVALKQAIMRMGVNTLIAVSRDLACYIQARKLFPRESIDVIYNGVDLQRYKKKSLSILRQQLGIPTDDVLVGSLGNIRPAKNYESLINAVSLLKNPRLHFIVAGHKKSDVMQELQLQMEQLGVAGQIHFIGFYENTPDFLAQMDLFVLCSSSEGFSIATIEAMAAGLPVIATRCGGPEEILEHMKTGYLVPIEAPEQLAAAISLLIGRPELAVSLADAGKEHVHNTFSLKTMLQAYLQQYQRLLGKN